MSMPVKNVFYHELSANIASPVDLSSLIPADAVLLGVFLRQPGDATTATTFQFYLDGDVIATVTTTGTASRSFWLSSQINSSDEARSADPPSWPSDMPMRVQRDNDDVALDIQVDLTLSDGTSPVVWLLYTRPLIGVGG